jgi:protein SCO1/2
MAALGAALRSLPAKIDKDVQVVFVTSDPARDTVPVMAKWLSNFDSGVANPFIGLATTVKAVDAYGAKLGIELDPPVVKDGQEEVTHGAQVLAFGANGTADLVWLPGSMTVAQYASDITTLSKQPA